MMLKDILDTFQFNCSLVSDSVTPCQNTLSITNTWTLLKLMSIESVMLSNYLNHCHPLLLLPSIFPSIRGFSNELALHKGGQSIGTSVSASVLPVNIQDWFPLEVNDLISLQSEGLLRVFSNTTVQKRQFFSAQPSLYFNSQFHTWLLEKPYLCQTDICQQSNGTDF